ncbi:MAG TPA: VWA domain-containing protein [Gaiellaceae bacterium]|nr:VWA domain-containing protein [Gaiellaceae bacterium]
MLASLTFLSPLGALVCLAALLPLAALWAAARREERAVRLLRLRPTSRRRLVAPAALAAAACICAGLAASQPALQLPQRASVRERSQVLYVVDVSRSMAAAPTAGGTTRLARARSVVRQLHAAAADVPSGLAGMTDRVLPYLFPTSDTAVFDATLRQSVLIEAPPPQEVNRNATSFGSLSSLAGTGYFDRTAKWRTCVLVTDGESRSYDPSSVGGSLTAAHCRLVVVRVGSGSDRVFGADGVPEAAYAPDPAAAEQTRALAQAAGGRAFEAGDAGAAARAVAASAEQGPVGRTTTRITPHALAPWLALAALVLAVACAVLRVAPESLRHATFAAYNRSVSRGTSA